jgi:translation elongation factor EF-4
LEDVDAFHKEVGDKCFHEDLTRGEKLSYKKSHPKGWLFFIQIVGIFTSQTP